MSKPEPRWSLSVGPPQAVVLTLPAAGTYPVEVRSEADSYWHSSSHERHIADVAKRIEALSDVTLALQRQKERHSKRSRPVALINIGQTIKLARELAKLNQRQLAEKMGVVRSYVTRVEGGLVEPNLESLLRFGDALGIPAWKLLRRAERTADRV